MKTDTPTFHKRPNLPLPPDNGNVTYLLGISFKNHELIDLITLEYSAKDANFMFMEGTFASLGNKHFLRSGCISNTLSVL